MSTLFGHVKGAFTGAQTERAGLLRKAHQGVVFLDEIGELGRDEQAKFLRRAGLEESRG
jgi:transcriptional regulatory protein RtcR